MLLNGVREAFEAWLLPGAVALFAVAGTYLVYHVALIIARRLLSKAVLTRKFLDAASGALGFSLCFLALTVALQTAPPELPLLEGFQLTATLLLVVSLTWAAVRCTSATGDMIIELNPVQSTDWRRGRRVETQTRFLVRGLNILVVIIGFGIALMAFQPMQQLGASLLASAGIGGIILGFAARPVLGNLLAGMQIALTQPFRIDDVLYVEDEWCWVEEVTTTYVVLRVWDLRRLVVPLQWFIENPFQNWSRNSAQMMGSVTLWLDYTTPVAPLRSEFARLLRQSDEWDGHTETVQVIDAGERAMQVRFLTSAADSTQLWNLRCMIREGLVAFVQAHYPENLPRLRAQLVDDDGTEAMAATSGDAMRAG